jgi:catechol 2,3-dioxygenase
MTDSRQAAPGAANGAAAEAGYGITPPGFRLPAAIRLGPVRLQVSDLERSLDYYREVLGFRLLRREAGTAALAAHGADDVLVELREGACATGGAVRRRLGLYHVAYLLPSRADLGRFLRHLGELGERAGASDHHVSEALYLQDPDGLGIEVYADRARALWETSGREVRMATAPLNVPEVLGAAGDSRWSGLPAGTTVGHLHLHVGNLDEAAAFYHEALGLDKVVWSYPGALFLSAGGYHHHLGLNTWAGVHAEPARTDEPRLLEWTIEVPGTATVAAAARSLEEAGYPVERAAEGDSFVTRDPWGTELRVTATGEQ